MNSLIIIERKGQRVLTTQQLAEAYEADAKIINRNFERNKDRYIEGKHYFSLSGDELKEFKGSRQNDDTLKYTSILYLWTERGALLHAKSLNTDKAWQIYDMLVETYFTVKEQQVSVPKSLPEALRLAADLAEKNIVLLQENETLKPKAEFYDDITGNEYTFEMAIVAKTLNFIGIGRNTLFEILRHEGILQRDNTPYQKYVAGGWFRTVETKFNKPNGDIGIKIKTVVYQKGMDKISKLLKKIGYKQRESA
jgi:phage antirepressor YoqD-like protein